ncbi:MAG TPA: hypothetical protein VG820_09505 [Fimbriimonadaceae bacterium]|nr:hypothetical protein [Fimbriimonadaceae bacterium]
MAHQSRSIPLIGGTAFLVVALVAAWLAAGFDGVAGVGLAAVLSALSVVSLKMFANAIAPPTPDRPQNPSFTAIVILAKLPLVAILIYLATRLSMSGLYCFLGTLGLVYSAIVWRLARAAS